MLLIYLYRWSRWNVRLVGLVGLVACAVEKRLKKKKRCKDFIFILRKGECKVCPGFLFFFSVGCWKFQVEKTSDNDNNDRKNYHSHILWIHQYSTTTPTHLHCRIGCVFLTRQWINVDTHPIAFHLKSQQGSSIPIYVQICNYKCRLSIQYGNF